jgi:hypothetical membrane protein
MGAAVAGIVADLVWSSSIHGDWGSQSHGTVDAYLALLSVYVAASLVAVAAAVRLRSRRWSIASILLSVVAVGVALVGIFAVALSREPFL